MRMLRSHPASRWGVLLGLLFLIVLAGCDSSANETIVLNDPLNPTEARFEFTYDADDLDDGVIQVTSEEADQLGDVIDAYGYGRSDVVSARIEAVTMERLTQPESSATQPKAAKVFDYLSRAEVYLGTSTDAPRIGSIEPVPFSAEVELGLESDRDVTSRVQSGSTRALLVLTVDDESLIGSGGDRIEVDVRFRVEVQQ